MDNRSGCSYWEQRAFEIDTSDTNNILGTTDQTRRGQPPCAPKDYGKCVAVEGGSTMQEGDLNRPLSQIPMNLSPPCMGIAGSSAQVEKRKVPHINDKSEQTKRVRAPNWTTDETNSLLMLKLEGLASGGVLSKPGKSWSKVVSAHLFSVYKVDRCFESCQRRWDTLLKEYKAIRAHELNSCISFWGMGEDEKSKCEKLPRIFLRGWYLLMEDILQAEANNRSASRKVTTSIHLPLSTTHTATTTIDSSQQQAEDEEQGMRDDYRMYSKIARFVEKQIQDALEPFFAMEAEKMLFKCVQCNSMGNAIPSGVQAPEGFNVARSLVNGHHTDRGMPSNGVPSHADIMQNTVGEANLNHGETSSAYGDVYGTCFRPENAEVIHKLNANVDLKCRRHSFFFP
jgi:hypothetical protein